MILFHHIFIFIFNLHCQLILRISGTMLHKKHGPDAKFPLYLKKAGLASRNIVRLHMLQKQSLQAPRPHPDPLASRAEFFFSFRPHQEPLRRFISAFRRQGQFGKRRTLYTLVARDYQPFSELQTICYTSHN